MTPSVAAARPPRRPAAPCASAGAARSARSRREVRAPPVAAETLMPTARARRSRASVGELRRRHLGARARARDSGWSRAPAPPCGGRASATRRAARSSTTAARWRAPRTATGATAQHVAHALGQEVLVATSSVPVAQHAPTALHQRRHGTWSGTRADRDAPTRRAADGSASAHRMRAPRRAVGELRRPRTRRSVGATARRAPCRAAHATSASERRRPPRSPGGRWRAPGRCDAGGRRCATG